MFPAVSKECILLMTEGSLKAIPFNIFLAILLALDLLYVHVPKLIVIGWLLAIIIFSLMRWNFCKKIIKDKLYEGKNHHILMQFLSLTLAVSIIWGSCYFISLHYLKNLHEFIIILVLGGMSAGAIATLSAYLPAYYAYIFPMFLPIIIYNYLSLNVDRTILATMFSLFVIMLIISAKINKKLLDKTFQLSHDLECLSITDSLTGLYNRRHFRDALLHELNRSKRNKYPINLVSIDIDNFKLINDNFGHPYGDTFLVELGEILKKTCKRSNDTIFRLGGDEFALIIANQTLKDAIFICELIIDRFNHHPKHHINPAKRTILNSVTLSIGIVNINFEHSYTAEYVVNIADKALYQAKNEGKNRIIAKQLH